jgi:hypothetical protein
MRLPAFLRVMADDHAPRTVGLPVFHHSASTHESVAAEAPRGWTDVQTLGTEPDVAK